MARRKTSEEYLQECKDKGYDLPIDEYVNARTKIKHRCIRCGYVYEQNPTHPVFMRVCEAWQTSLSLQIYRNNQLQMVLLS